jgi:hypothetical protein
VRPPSPIASGNLISAEPLASISSSASRRARLDAALRFFARQRERHRMLGVVHGAEDHRPIHVAREKPDEHFHADARDELKPPSSPGPGRRDA